MDKLICVINGDNTAKVMSALRKITRKQTKMNVWFMIFAAAMVHDLWVQSENNKKLADEIMVLKSEVKKLQQQIGD